MYISDLLEASSIAINTQVATKEQAVDKLIGLLVAQGAVKDAEVFRQDIMAREALGSTGISEGIAIPHAKSAAVDYAAVSVITVPAGVDFQARDGQPSKLLFMIAAPADAKDLHIELLGHISLVLIDGDNRRSLLQAEDAAKFLTYLDRMEAKKFVGLD